MKYHLSFVICLFSLLRTIYNQKSDCGTAIECYVKAIDLVNTARAELYSAKDKFDQSVAILQKYTDEQFAQDRNRLNQVEQNVSKLSSKIDENKNELGSRIDDLSRRLHNHNCRQVQTTCDADGGGNMQFLDRHNIVCGSNEYMRQFQLLRCSNATGVYYLFTCCSFP
jgi:hypothetical protein